MRKLPPPASTPRPATAPARLWLFRAVLLLSPVLLFALAEATMRLAGLGGYPPLLRRVGPVEGGTLILADPAGAVSWFFANRKRPGYNEQHAFVDPKPTNTFRVFLLGESAMKGYPQPRNLASSAFLQTMLQDVWPERRIEVINLGTTAVASYPVRGMLEEALAYEPDLVVIHTGHNEFYGTYGVASVGRAGSRPAMLRLTRWMHSLALVQGVSRLLEPDSAELDRTLMEMMVGRDFVAADDPRRAAAARNLHHNLSAMLAACRERGVPALVCTLPSNERDLAPVGRMPPASDTLNAREHFERGRRLHEAGQSAEALADFIRARDLDTMPWRATSAAQDAIRRAAAEQGGVVCDLEAAFRAASPGGSIGWELMDDHVHPTLRGQALMAEQFVAALTNLAGHAGLAPAALARLRPWADYARELGDNPYDRYGVAFLMRVLFEVPFLRESNPAGFARFNAMMTSFEATADPEILPVLREWQTYRPHAGAKRPLSGMVARVLMRQRRFADALELYEIAAHAVPEYTSWHMEYVYFALAARERLNGRLTDADLARAGRVIEQGGVLLSRGFSETGHTERYLGRLHQLRGEFAEAIPYLNVSRQKLGGMDLVAADQALIISYLRTGRTNDAVRLAEQGAAHAGQFAPFYRRMLDELRGGTAPAGAP